MSPTFNFDLISYISNNVSLRETIGVPILIQLDFQSLLACRLVNHSWKIFFIDNPTFWLEICSEKGKNFLPKYFIHSSAKTCISQ